MRRVKANPGARAMLKSKNKEEKAKAWATVRRMLALPMVPLEKLEEAADIVLKKAPAAFKDVVKEFNEYYIKGPVGATKNKRGRATRREPM